jgi:hypothetical protein
MTLASRFRDLFEAEVGAPFDAGLHLPNELESRYVTGSGEPCPVLVGSPGAVRRPMLNGSYSDVQDLPVGYFLTGFSGYGINSNAFYFVSAQPGWRAFLRIPFGNVYADPEREAREVLDALAGWRRLSSVALVDVLAYANMGSSIVQVDGESFPNLATALAGVSL